MMDTILGLSDFKADASRLLKDIHEHPRSLILTQNGRASAVVQNYEEFQRQRDGLLMLKLMIQGEADIQNNELTPHDEVFAELRDQLKVQKPGDD
jgi:PHD/YefM family antitoxin component YafN of YafNO toxin-antitoxin module